jgi:hypothetical protein
MVLRRFLAPVLGVFLLAGCAGQGGGSVGPSQPPGSGAPPASASSATPGMPLDPVGPSARPGPSAGVLTLTGTVVAGVEPKCLLLRHDSGDYLLLTGSRPVPPVGTEVTATGTVKKGMVTTCQQGIPFVVREIRAA